MKIVSRPDEQVVGSGPYQLRVSFEQLQYIGALMYVTRLGGGPYQDAVFELMNTIEEIFDEDFLEGASNDVNMHVSILDDRGNVIQQHHHDHVCIEV